VSDLVVILRTNSTGAETAMRVAGVATDATIDVDSITGITNGDNIGVELDDGTMHWTTVNGAPSGTVITLTAVLPSATAIDNRVYAHKWATWGTID
jgi:hypothetical protein